jgi:type II secretory pathway component GspD/PulD (secretin)
MPIEKLAAEFKPRLLAIAIFAFAASSGTTRADTRFHLSKDPQGRIAPFRAVEVPLADFVREYARITSTTIAMDATGSNLKGTVTLFLRRPLTPEILTETFHRILADNNYAIVDAPSGNGWILVHGRDARDLALPVYETGSVPDTARLVTAYHELKYADAESVAHTMRSFMPANSRIIPVSGTQVFITDTGSNIRKLNWIISRMDTQEGAKKEQRAEAESGVRGGPPPNCGERRIEKLVVEKLEIRDSVSGKGPDAKPFQERGRK